MIVQFAGSRIIVDPIEASVIALYRPHVLQGLAGHLVQLACVQCVIEGQQRRDRNDFGIEVGTRIRPLHRDRLFCESANLPVRHILGTQQWPGHQVGVVRVTGEAFALFLPIQDGRVKKSGGCFDREIFLERFLGKI